MTALSVIVITHNEEKNIGECLESVRWADEIIVVDSQSTDKTVEIAKKYTDNDHVTSWIGYSESKNIALSRSSGQWILWIDADERVPKNLAEEIQSIVRKDSSGFAGYEIARRAYFIGKWIRHCGWYPGYVVRLFRKEGVRFNDALVHEKLEINGTIGRLTNDLLHYTDENLFHYFSKFNSYTSLAARELAPKGRKISLYDLLVRPPYLFFKMYILKLGFLDGMHGFVLSILSANYVFIKYAKLWDEDRKR